MLNISNHQQVMLELLKSIYQDPALGPILGFKGGTALYLFYQLPRFSVDLDFDLLDLSKKNLVFQKIELLAKKAGQLREKRDKYYSLFFLLSYGQNQPQIKIEINKRVFTSSYELKSFLGIPILVMKREDILAHKLVALLERKHTANRDIFDIWFCLKNHYQVNWQIIKERTGESKAGYLRRVIKFLGERSNKSILAGVGELLDRGTKTWIKTHLLPDIIFQLKVLQKID